MGRDYTDYVCIVFGGGERKRHVEHFRQLRKDPEAKQFEYNGNIYIVQKDDAMNLRNYRPWPKWSFRRPLHHIREAFRTKRVAGILYQEPSFGPARELISTKEPTSYACTECDYKSDTLKQTKMHIIGKHKLKDYAKHIKVTYTTRTAPKASKRHVVYPMHISRIHQPSGRQVGSPSPEPSARPNPILYAMGIYEGIDPTQPSFPPVTDMVSPRVMKAILDRPHFRRAYKSFKFGNLVAISQKWWLWLALAVVGIFVIFILTGNFQA